jgi:uncharacterized protein YjbI with pentapeptide repeats
VADLIERYRNGERNFSWVELPEGESLRDLDLPGLICDHEWIDSIDFTGANLRGGSFRNAHLKCCVFDGADLEGADFRGAGFDGASFTAAKLNGAQFAGATTYGAELKEGDLPCC